MPAKAGIQNHLKILGSHLRGNDAKGGFKSFYEVIGIQPPIFVRCHLLLSVNPVFASIVRSSGSIRNLAAIDLPKWCPIICRNC